jgi:tetratricopeptide (TPR) repeat protein
MRRFLAALVMVLAFDGTAWADDWADCKQIADPDRSIRGCDNVITPGQESRDNLAMAYNNRGAAYGNKGNYDQAIADESKAIQLKPQFAAAYMNRGFAYGHKGDYAQVIADESMALRLDPSLAEAYVSRGAAYEHKGDYIQEISDDAKAIELNPDFAEAYANRGGAYETKGDYDRAIADETKAIELSPQVADAYVNRGAAYANTGDYDRAIADYDKAIGLEPTIAQAYTNRAAAYTAKGDYDRAIADYDKAIQLKPVIANYGKAIALKPTEIAEAYTNRAAAYTAKGDYDRAIADYDKAIQLKPDHGYAFYGRGNAYAAKGDPEKALADFRSAAQFVSDSDLLHVQALAQIADLTTQNASAADKNESGVAPAVGKAILHEEVVNPTGDPSTVANALNAAVSWRFVENGNNGPAIEADLQVPERRMKVTITIHKNTDASLPASHLVEVRFSFPADLPGKDIEKLSRIFMKPAAHVQGGPLAGAAVKVADGFFWIALSVADNDVKNNLALLRQGDWIDLPFTYKTGQRAILTFQKGAEGDRVVQRAMAAWSGDTVAETGQVAPNVERPQAAANSEPSGVKNDRPTMTAAGGRRVALVIGNSAYRNVPSLNNPINDASLIARALKADGFDVTVADNLARDGLSNALQAFATKADDADWAVVYFAGHGIEMGGTNYLIPVDAKLATDRDVGFEAIPVDQVFSAVDGAHQLRVLILDACRNNPFADTMKRSTGAVRAVGRGLTRIEPTRGTVIVYSARPGQVAADGDGADSPFATALAHHLTDPGVEVLKLFRLVRDDVLAATGNTQEVFQDSSLPGQDFFFRPQ